MIQFEKIFHKQSPNWVAWLVWNWICFLWTAVKQGCCHKSHQRGSFGFNSYVQEQHFMEKTENYQYFSCKLMGSFLAWVFFCEGLCSSCELIFFPSSFSGYVTQNGFLAVSRFYLKKKKKTGLVKVLYKLDLNCEDRFRSKGNYWLFKSGTWVLH